MLVWKHYERFVSIFNVILEILLNTEERMKRKLNEIYWWQNADYTVYIRNN